MGTAPGTPSLGTATCSTAAALTPRSSSSLTVERRSKNGCVTCRLGRVKCDEELPQCSPCRERGYTCRWTKGDVDDEALRAELRPRRRQLRACQRCKDRKIRCSGPGEREAPCASCSRAKHSCEWPNSGRSQSPPTHKADAGLSPPWNELMADQSAVTKLIKQYFDSIHQWGFLTFIHPPTFFRLLHKRKTPRLLTMMMVALVIRTQTTDYDWALCDAITDEALAAHQTHIDDGFGAIELMVCVLLRLYQSCRGKHVSAWMLTGAALRMCQYLSLHVFDNSYSLEAQPDINPLLKPESLRRLAWSVYFLDTMADAGVHGMHQTTEDSFHIQLPCEESDFLRSSMVAAPLLSEINMQSLPELSTLSRLGLSAFIIRTAAMRRRILHFASKIRWSRLSIQRLVAQTDDFEEELKAMLDQLPHSFEYTEENLYIHSTQQPAFILLHILQHNCCLMLARARLLISTMQPGTQLAVMARKDRLQHAFACSRVVADAIRLDVPCDDFVGTASYTCLEISLFEPLRLASDHMQDSIDRGHIVQALQPLMEMIRRQARWSVTLQQLRIEACRRLVRCGYQDQLTGDDWKTTQENYRLAGSDDTEFSFWTNRWHWFQRHGHDGNAITPAAEALLDIRGSQSGSATPLAQSEPVAQSSQTVRSSRVTGAPVDGAPWQLTEFSPIDWSALSQALTIDNIPGHTPILDLDQGRSWDILDYRPEQILRASGPGVSTSRGSDATLGTGLFGMDAGSDGLSSLFDGDAWPSFAR